MSSNSTAVPSTSIYSNEQVGLRTKPSPFKLNQPPPPPPIRTGSSHELTNEPNPVIMHVAVTNGIAGEEQKQIPKKHGHKRNPTARHQSSSSITSISSTSSFSIGSSAFSSFLLSPAYHAYERELRTDGSVDLSRKSGGSVGRSAKGSKKPVSAKSHLPDFHAGMNSLKEEHEFEENEDDTKGDYAIVIRLESKLLKQQQQIATPAAETQPPSSESSTTVQPSSSPSPSPTNENTAAIHACPSPLPSPSNGRKNSHEVQLPITTAADSTSTIRRVDKLSDSTLHGSHRLRTLTQRLTHAGLKYVREKQIVNGCVLLKVYAPAETLEQAAFRLRLKMPLKPHQEDELTSTRTMTSNILSPTPMSTAASKAAVSTAAAAAASSSSAASASSSSPLYTFIPFDPSIRDQFLGTQDPHCLFRSSERQILIDFILRTSLSEGGAGLGNQVVNELEARKKAIRKRKEKIRKMKEKILSNTPTTPSTPTASAAADPSTPTVNMDGDSSDEEDTASNARDEDEEVPHIEQYITARFPLHSSRLDALDSWISYWHLRKKLGAMAWCVGLFLQPLDAISSYFGNEVAFYFSFMNFYIRSLIIPSILGLVLFLTQLSWKNIDSPLLPAFSLFFAIWSSILIEVWKRRESEFSWKWGSFAYESEEETTRPEFEGELKTNALTGLEERTYPVHKRLLKLFASVTLWCAILGGFGLMMIYIFSNWDANAKEIQQLKIGSGYFSLDMLFVPCLWGILIPLLDLLFNRLALEVTDWENWKLQSTYRALFIAKVFSFRFINAFLALYYYMFHDGGTSDGSLVRLTTSVASFMICGQILRFMISVIVPALEKRWNGWRAMSQRRAALSLQQKNGTPAATSAEVAAPVVIEELSQAWLEFTYPEYDHFEEYANMVIQFGYVCFFSVVFPFAPLCALINNLIMVRVGAYKLCRLTRRPLACKASGLGIWLSVLQLMSVVAVLTNCAIIGITSLQLSSWFPEISTSTKILLIFAFEHLILLMKIAIAFAIPDVTAEVEMQRKKEKLSLNQANTELMELRRKQILQRVNIAGDTQTDSLYTVSI